MMAIEVASPGADLLRRLAEVRLERPLVLSLYLDLNPREFATPPARATAIRSVLDEADRRVRGQDGMSHEDRTSLAAGLQRARDVLEGNLEGLRSPGLAVFVCEPEGLMETIGLPRAVPNRVAVDRSPLVGPLTAVAREERWCVALVSRQDARLFRGSPDGLREVERLHDDVHGQHDQGGWSQARYQRSVDKEVADHLKSTAERLMTHFQRQPFQRLVLGGPREVTAELEGKLHAYLTDRLAGRIDVDVEAATAQDVLDSAHKCFDRLEDEREREALDRIGAGRGVTGLADVLPALNERRAETLLLADGFAEPGALCPRCGWLGDAGQDACPVDGTAAERRDDIGEPAIELAIQQAADVLPVRRLSDELRDRGGIAAVLRY